MPSELTKFGHFRMDKQRNTPETSSSSSSLTRLQMMGWGWNRHNYIPIFFFFLLFLRRKKKKSPEPWIFVLPHSIKTPHHIRTDPRLSLFDLIVIPHPLPPSVPSIPPSYRSKYMYVPTDHQMVTRREAPLRPKLTVYESSTQKPCVKANFSFRVKYPLIVVHSVSNTHIHTHQNQDISFCGGLWLSEPHICTMITLPQLCDLHRHILVFHGAEVVLVCFLYIEETTWASPRPSQPAQENKDIKKNRFSRGSRI